MINGLSRIGFSVNGKASNASVFSSLIAKVLGGIALVGSLTAHAAVAPVTTQGNQVLFGGKVGSISGNSMFWSNNGWGGSDFYNASLVSWLHTDWKSNLVRAAMGVEDDGGYLQDPVANKVRVKAVVEAAIANDMYVLIDWHSHHAEQKPNEAIAFFKEMAQTYGNVNNVIFEIYNEPKENDWHNDIKPYAINVINAIRSTGAKNLIVVGTETWSQRVDKAADDRITGFDNIAYALHFYIGTDGHGQGLRNKAQYALDHGIPLFVTEWGVWGKCGVGCIDWADQDAWKNFMLRNNISNAAWGLTTKYEESSFLNAGASTTGGWTNNQLTNVGAMAKDLVSNWPQITQDPSSSSSSSSSVAPIGSVIEAESYVSMSGVKTEPCNEGGSNVGYIDAGDWMTYSVNVPAAGSYLVSYRVASMNGGGVIQLEKAGGAPVYAKTNVPSTGGWQTWVTVTQVVTLPAGQQAIALSAPTGGYNINWFKIESLGVSSSSSSSVSSASSTSSTATSSSTSSASSAASAPLVTVKAASYSYESGTKTEPTTDGGGSNVGWIDAGDWLSYVGTPITIPQTGTYTIEFRVASAVGGGSLSFEEAGGSASYATVAIPNTGGWQQWTTVKATVNLTAGVHKFGVGAKAGGWNFNWFSITQGVK